MTPKNSILCKFTELLTKNSPPNLAMMEKLRQIQIERNSENKTKQNKHTNKQKTKQKNPKTKSGVDLK